MSALPLSVLRISWLFNSDPWRKQNQKNHLDLKPSHTGDVFLLCTTWGFLLYVVYMFPDEGRAALVPHFPVHVSETHLWNAGTIQHQMNGKVNEYFCVSSQNPEHDVFAVSGCLCRVPAVSLAVCHWAHKKHPAPCVCLSFSRYLEAMLGIRDIFVRIQNRIPGSVPLTSGSGFVSGSGSNSGSDSFLHWF
jgi:hypothetical protein